MSNKEFALEITKDLEALTQEQYEEVKAYISSRFVHNQKLFLFSKFVFRMAEECRPKLLGMNSKSPI